MDMRPKLLDEVKSLVGARSYPLADIKGPTTEPKADGEPFPEMIQLLDDGAPFTTDADGTRRCYYCQTKEGSHYSRCPYGRVLKAYAAAKEGTVQAMADRVRGQRRYSHDVPTFSKGDRNVIERLIRELTDEVSDDLTAISTALYALHEAQVYRFDWPKSEYGNMIDARGRVDMVNRMVSPNGDTFAKDGEL